MKKFILVIALIALLPVAPAWADSFVLGDTYHVITYQYAGTPYTVGGGSFDVSRLNGEDLPWVYCVDLLHDISPNGSYPYTEVRTDGFVNGAPVSNAGQVAWLLDTYASTAAGNDAMEAALQGLIWKAIYGGAFEFIGTTDDQKHYFDLWRTADVPAGNVGDYLWLSPEPGCYSQAAGAPAGCVQGVVTYSPVPEPGSTLLLLGAGLVGLSAWRRRHP